MIIIYVKNILPGKYIPTSRSPFTQHYPASTEILIRHRQETMLCLALKLTYTEQNLVNFKKEKQNKAKRKDMYVFVYKEN